MDSTSFEQLRPSALLVTAGKPFRENLFSQGNRPEPGPKALSPCRRSPSSPHQETA